MKLKQRKALNEAVAAIKEDPSRATIDYRRMLQGFVGLPSMFGRTADDVVVLGIVAPNDDAEVPYLGSNMKREEVIPFLESLLEYLKQNGVPSTH